MTKYRFHWVDVFTDTRFGGNQLAVFTEAEGLSDGDMQTIARELNISESTFVFPPEDSNNDYRIRIFTPGRELPMAGHPTVGTAFVLHHLSMVQSSQIRLEENVGVIPVEIQTEGHDLPLIFMTQPQPQFGAILDEQRADFADLLSIPESMIRTDVPIQVLSSGVPFVYVPLVSMEAIQQATLRRDIWEKLLKGQEADQVFVFTMDTTHPTSTVHSRMFAPSMGITEDPATGAASGPLGAYLLHYGLISKEQSAAIISEQGFEMNRPSYIHIQVEETDGEFTRVRVGGTTVAIGSGYIEL